jgi:hypothetical protein
MREANETIRTNDNKENNVEDNFSHMKFEDFDEKFCLFYFLSF